MVSSRSISWTVNAFVISVLLGIFFFENGNIMTSPVLTFFMDMFVASVTQASRNDIPGVIQCDKEEKSLCWNFSGYLRV